MSAIDWVCKKISLESASGQLSAITISGQQVLPSKLDAWANVTTCCCKQALSGALGAGEPKLSAPPPPPLHSRPPRVCSGLVLHTCCYFSLPSLHDYGVFFVFRFLQLDTVVKNSTREKFAYICGKLNEMQ